MARLSNWVLPLIAFFIFANPVTFKFVASIAGNWVANSYGLPTQAGVLIHALVFIFVVGLLMKRVSFYGAGRHIKTGSKHSSNPVMALFGNKKSNFEEPEYLDIKDVD
jgi:hypothetical protein